MRAFIILGFAFLVVVGSFAAPALKQKKVAPDIVGEWKFIRITSGGTSTQIEEHIIFTFRPDGSLLREDSDPNPLKASYTTNVKKKIPEIDVTPPMNDPAPLMRGIYQIDGDKLMIVVTFLKDADRPNEFVAAEGVKVFMWEFRRIRIKE